jgi:type II secretory pathway component PulL
LQLQDILHYQSIVDEQSHKISYIYQKVYPEQTLPTQIKETIEQDFAKKNSTQSGFYHLLFSFGEIFKHSEGLMIKNMHYKAPILRLELEATNYSTIEKLIQDFKDTRLNIHQNKTEQQPNHVKVSLDISEEPLK